MIKEQIEYIKLCGGFRQFSYWYPLIKFYIENYENKEELKA
jgi:hypothetical protein